MTHAPTLPTLPQRPLAAVVNGASAGGVEALLAILTGLPRGYRLPVMVVLHMPDDRTACWSMCWRSAWPCRSSKL